MFERESWRSKHTQPTESTLVLLSPHYSLYFDLTFKGQGFSPSEERQRKTTTTTTLQLSVSERRHFENAISWYSRFSEHVQISVFPPLLFLKNAFGWRAQESKLFLNNISIHKYIATLLIFWFSAGTKEVNATGKSFTVRSSLQLQVDKRDDGVAYTCSVEHVTLSSPYMTTEVLEVHCECSHTHPLD